MSSTPLPPPAPKRRPPGWARRALAFVAYLVGVLAVMSTVVSLLNVPPGADPATYAAAAGGPTWWGYHAVHSGPGLLVLLLGAVVAVRRRRRQATTPFTDMSKPLG